MFGYQLKALDAGEEEQCTDAALSLSEEGLGLHSVTTGTHGDHSRCPQSLPTSPGLWDVGIASGLRICVSWGLHGAWCWGAPAVMEK